MLVNLGAQGSDCLLYTVSVTTHFQIGGFFHWAFNSSKCCVAYYNNSLFLYSAWGNTTAATNHDYQSV